MQAGFCSAHDTSFAETDTCVLVCHCFENGMSLSSQFLRPTISSMNCSTGQTATTHLLGQALQVWHHATQNCGDGDIPFSKLAEVLTVRYRPYNPERVARQSLQEIKQGTMSGTDHDCAFRALLADISNPNFASQISTEPKLCVLASCRGCSKKSHLGPNLALDQCIYLHFGRSPE